MGNALVDAVISSPIGSDEEEEIMDGFFEWKLGRTKKEVTEDKIREVFRLVNEQCWNIDDLKEMSHITSPIYGTAVQKGVSEGMARGFKADPKLFKTEWRKAKLVMNLRNIPYNS